MQKLLALFLVPLLVAASATAQEQPQPAPSTTERVVKGVGGAVVGGVVGSQIGGGRGNTAMTAAGAATGAVLGSGCKTTAGTIIGGIAGGLLGSQMGKSQNGKNLGAGIGAAAGAVLGSDCTDGALAATGGTQPPRLRPIRINGMAAFLGGAYRLEPFAGLPPVKTMADVRALNEAVRHMNALTVGYLKRGDYDAALVSNHLAARLAEYQLYVASSTRAAIEAMATNVGGASSIAPGSYAVLPVFDRGGVKPVVLSAAEAPNPFIALRPMNGLQVAASGLDALLGVLGGGNRQPQQQRAAAMEAVESLGSMPIGTPVTLPSGIVVERTVDSFIVHNPNKTTASVNLGELGYLPPIREPGANRKAAGKIMLETMESTHQVFERTLAPLHDGVWPAAPNSIVVDGRQTALIDVGGTITQDPKKSAQSAKEYGRTGSPFRLSMDAIEQSLGSGERQQFQQQCLGPGGRSHTFGVDFTGAYAEIVVLWCGNGHTARVHDVYERQFYLTETGMLQTWSSLLKDARTISLLKEFDKLAEANENLVQIIPVVGNVESGFKCVSGGSASLTRVAMTTGSDAPKIDDARAFVKAIYDPYTAPGWDAGRVLDCASALPAVGSLAKTAGQIGKGLDARLAVRGNEIYDALKLFDTALTSRTAPVETAQTLSKLSDGSQAAGFIAKTYYDGVQTAKTFKDFSSSLMTLSS
jgi:outer membrane lipoprotein SlyB